MAKFELTDKELEQINGGVQISFMGTKIEITPDVIHDAWEDGTGQTYMSLIKTFGKQFKTQIKQLYNEYADPKTNPNGYTMPKELDDILKNL